LPPDAPRDGRDAVTAKLRVLAGVGDADAVVRAPAVAARVRHPIKAMFRTRFVSIEGGYDHNRPRLEALHAPEPAKECGNRCGSAWPGRDSGRAEAHCTSVHVGL
jgi:hypothetical protein